MLCCEWSERYNVVSIMISFVIVIFSYGKFRSLFPNFRDPFMRKLNIPYFNNLDGWSLIHFISYAALGYYYSSCDIEVLGFGLGWEGFEHFLGQNRPAILGGFGDIPQNINAKENEKWWYGRWSDLLMNTIGFYIGSYFS